LNQELWCACANNDLENIKKYIELGADKNLKNIPHYKPIHFATIYGDQKIITYLLEKRVDVEAKDERERTALHHAVINNIKKNNSELLLSYGALRNVKDCYGLTPYDYTCKRNKAEIKAYFEETDPKNKIFQALIAHQKLGNFIDIIFE
jgi:ankyrin repeat protein